MNKYFESYIKIAPFSHSLWRTSEADAISTIEIKKPMLDIGCGFGEFGGVFYESSVEIGVDISEKDLEIAKSKNIYEKLIQADAVNLPFENNYFASCISISTIEHIKLAEKVIKEVYRVLKKDGQFIFTVPTLEINNSLFGAKILNKLCLKRLAQGYINTYHKVFKHETIVEKETWLKWLKDAGFKNLNVINTLSTEHIMFFELFLLTAWPSQILRNLTGKRHVIETGLRTKTLAKLNDLLNKRNKDKLNSSNILVVATK